MGSRLSFLGLAGSLFAGSGCKSGHIGQGLKGGASFEAIEQTSEGELKLWLAAEFNWVA
jgi:hypothetical protein